MTYFDPAIFNKQNLKPKDRKELDFWEDIFKNVISTTRDEFECACIGLGETIFKIVNEISAEWVGKLHEALGAALQEVLIGIIEEYEDGVIPQKEYETYIYEGEDK